MGSRQLTLSVIGAESTVPQTPRLDIGIIAVNDTGKSVGYISNRLQMGKAIAYLWQGGFYSNSVNKNMC